MPNHNEFLEYLKQEKRRRSEVVNMTFQISPEDEGKVKALANYADITTQELVNQLIKKYAVSAWEELSQSNSTYEIKTEVRVAEPAPTTPKVETVASAPVAEPEVKAKESKNIYDLLNLSKDRRA